MNSITVIKNPPCTKMFSTLRIGAPFLYCEALYIKTASTSGIINAIKLGDGVVRFDGHTKVLPTKITITFN